MQVGSMNYKHQGVIPCTPHGSDATSWDHKLTTLEGVMAQMDDVVTNNNPL